MTPAHREYPGVLPANRTDFIHLPLGREPERPEYVTHRKKVLEEECRIIATMLVSDSALVVILAWFGAWISVTLAILLWASLICWLWSKTRELTMLELRHPDE